MRLAFLYLLSTPSLRVPLLSCGCYKNKASTPGVNTRAKDLFLCALCLLSIQPASLLATLGQSTTKAAVCGVEEASLVLSLIHRRLYGRRGDGAGGALLLYDPGKRQGLPIRLPYKKAAQRTSHLFHPLQPQLPRYTRTLRLLP